ncbi:MAG: hypothetical protein ABH851_01790 [Methanobacteriota archaeon]
MNLIEKINIRIFSLLLILTSLIVVTGCISINNDNVDETPFFKYQHEYTEKLANAADEFYKNSSIVETVNYSHGLSLDIYLSDGRIITIGLMGGKYAEEYKDWIASNRTIPIKGHVNFSRIDHDVMYKYNHPEPIECLKDEDCVKCGCFCISKDKECPESESQCTGILGTGICECDKQKCGKIWGRVS